MMMSGTGPAATVLAGDQQQQQQQQRQHQQQRRSMTFSLLPLNHSNNDTDINHDKDSNDDDNNHRHSRQPNSDSSATSLVVRRPSSDLSIAVTAAAAAAAITAATTAITTTNSISTNSAITTTTAATATAGPALDLFFRDSVLRPAAVLEFRLPLLTSLQFDELMPASQGDGGNAPSPLRATTATAATETETETATATAAAVAAGRRSPTPVEGGQQDYDSMPDIQRGSILETAPSSSSTANTTASNNNTSSTTTTSTTTTTTTAVREHQNDAEQLQSQLQDFLHLFRGFEFGSLPEPPPTSAPFPSSTTPLSSSSPRANFLSGAAEGLSNVREPPADTNFDRFQRLLSGESLSAVQRPASSRSRTPTQGEIRRGVAFPTSAPRIQRAAAILSRNGTTTRPQRHGEPTESGRSREQRPGEFRHTLHSWTGDVGPNDTLGGRGGGSGGRGEVGGGGGAGARGTTVTSSVAATATAGGDRSARAVEIEGHNSRMNGQDNGNMPTASPYDYAGWAPGTTATEHSRPTLHTLRAMANRNQDLAPLSPSDASSSPTSRTGNRTTSLERRYQLERQRQQLRMMHLEQSRQPPERGLRSLRSGQDRNPVYGFASTVVDADGNPIDTGTNNNETPNPRSIVYNPPPPPPPRPENPTSTTSASQYEEQRISELASDIDQIERRLATISDPSARDHYEALHAHYTQMQRQERLERMERHQRAYFRAERLRRAGANTAEGNSGGSSRVNGRANPLDELRRGLYDLNRERHSAFTPYAYPSELAHRHLEQAIRYLYRVHSPECTNQADRLRAAKEEGFAPKKLKGTELDDFITDPKVLGKLPETSWLTPGAVFSGSQRAVSNSSLSNAGLLPLLPNSQRESGTGGGGNIGNSSSSSSGRLDMDGVLGYPSRGDANSYAAELPSMMSGGYRVNVDMQVNPMAAASRAAWIESVMQRDRDMGAMTTPSRGNSPIHLATATQSSIDRVRASRVVDASAARGGSSSSSSTIQSRRPGSSSGGGGGGGGGSSSSSNAAQRTAYNEDTWPVKVTITSVDYQSMTITGTMEAMNVPSKDSPASNAPRGVASSSSINSSSNQGQSVTANNGGSSEGKDGGTDGASGNNTTITTFLEGEIIDLQNFSLETRGYKANSEIDSNYWRRLEPFKSVDDASLQSKALSTGWLREKIGREHVLMRWKEKCFVTPSEDGMGLTISGFYYISLNRASGRIEGLYFDPKSSPFQHLCLNPEPLRHFPTYTFQ